MATTASLNGTAVIPSTTADALLFDDSFHINSIDSAKYDRVSRIEGASLAMDVTITLDINTQLFPVVEGDTLNIVLASSLALDGSKEDGKGWRDGMNGQGSLADMFDYVCHGKVYRFEEGEGEHIKVYVSFGGLLLYIVGPYKKLTSLRIDYIYLLMKR